MPVSSVTNNGCNRFANNNLGAQVNNGEDIGIYSEQRTYSGYNHVPPPPPYQENPDLENPAATPPSYQEPAGSRANNVENNRNLFARQEGQQAANDNNSSYFGAARNFLTNKFVAGTRGLVGGSLLLAGATCVLLGTDFLRSTGLHVDDEATRSTLLKAGYACFVGSLIGADVMIKFAPEILECLGVCAEVCAAGAVG